MLDEGFKIETFGGSNSPNIQTEAKNQMGSLESHKDTAIFANWTGNAAYGVKANAYLESLVETTYAVTKNVSTWEVKDNPSFDSFKQYGPNRNHVKLCWRLHCFTFLARRDLLSSEAQCI
jgi:hypothetical protein